MINAYLTDDITIKQTTYDQWGNSTKVSSTVKGRIEFRTKFVRNIQGEQVVSTAKVYLATVSIGHEDRISYDSKEYRILNIEEKKDFSTKFLKLDLA